MTSFSNHCTTGSHGYTLVVVHSTLVLGVAKTVTRRGLFLGGLRNLKLVDNTFPKVWQTLT